MGNQKWTQSRLASNSWWIIENISFWLFWIWKAYTLLYLLNNEPNIDKTYLYAKDPYEAKYQLLNNKHKSVALKHCDDPKVFIEYSNEMENI